MCVLVAELARRTLTRPSVILPSRATGHMDEGPDLDLGNFALASPCVGPKTLLLMSAVEQSCKGGLTLARGSSCWTCPLLVLPSWCEGSGRFLLLSFQLQRAESGTPLALGGGSAEMQAREGGGMLPGQFPYKAQGRGGAWF